MAWNFAADDGGSVLSLDGELVVGNATIAGDGSNSGSGAEFYLDGNASLTLENSILYGTGSASVLYGDGTAYFSGTYNNAYSTSGSTVYSGVTDPTGSNGNMSVDPYFGGVSDDANSTNDDWSLTSTSTCIDAGNSDSSYNDADGTQCDMGAFGGPSSDWDQ